MITLELRRVESNDQGTFGQLFGLAKLAFTGELPWRENQRSISCIPEGTYQVIWSWSPHFKRRTYRLLNVPGRDGVLIHSANLMGDTSLGYRAQLNGCIALGERLGWLDGQKAILVSRPAIRFLEDSLQQQPFMLEVRNA